MATAPQQTQIERPALSEQQARNLAAEAYICGYPIVLMDITREVCTNVRNAAPVPKDSFNLMLRLYWPKKEVLEGMWQPPAVRRVEARKRQVA